jgi:UPF0716 protein FxsA
MVSAKLGIAGFAPILVSNVLRGANSGKRGFFLLGRVEFCMLRLFFLLLLILPIAEIVVLVQVSQQLGFWATLALIVLAGIVGLHVMKWQSARMLQKANVLGLSAAGGADILSGALLTLAGLLFLIPGFITDVVAVLLLLPLTRSVLAKWLLSKGMAGMASSFGSGAVGSGAFGNSAFGGGIRFGSFSSFSRTWSAGAPTSTENSKVLEGEFTREGLNREEQSREEQGREDQRQSGVSLPESTKAPGAEND